MRKKQLENAFMQYMESISDEQKQRLSQMAQSKSCIIFGTDELHYNRRQNTLYIKPLQMLMHDVHPVGGIDWCALAFEVHQGQEVQEAEALVGDGNPYQSKPEQLTLQMDNQPYVYAVPYEFGRKITQMMEGKKTETV